MEFSALVIEPINADVVLDKVGTDEDGAGLLFVGVVRDHNEGRSVKGVHYYAYEKMADLVLREIVEEATNSLGTDRIVVVHRLGKLKVGDISVAIAVSSPHRANSYEASRFIIEEINRRLPIWKKELYSDGNEEWVDGTIPVNLSQDVNQS